MSNTLLEAYSRYCKQQEKKLPFSFNLLDEQCGHIVENSHTNLLMKILQYNNHYGHVFLESFFTFMGLSIKLDGDQDIVFNREKFYAKGRIDGFIYQENKFALIIENKVNGATNQKEQLKKYIEEILKDKNVFSQQDKNEEKIWVCFLTKDGREKPDVDSQRCMRDKGICSQICEGDNDVVEGPRYVAINYQDHILPWLKEEIQPIVQQRDHILNTGILQYIDFLEGMFGLRQADSKLLYDSKEWLEQQLESRLRGKSFNERNSVLEGIRKEIDDQLKAKLNNNKRSDNSALRRYAGLLSNLIIDLNDEPMKPFFDYTRHYFESNGLMKKCVISHVFNYNYIQIRDASWPRSVHFEWYPLGIDRLTCKETSLKFQLCLHVENKNYCAAFLKKTASFKSNGFTLQDRRHQTLSFNHGIDKPSIDIIHLHDQNLSVFLNTAYRSIDSDMIKDIEDAITLAE